MTPSCRLMDFTNSKILCIFAHPDDESYIVGGTIARAVNEGAEVTVISATKGDKGFQHINDDAQKQKIMETRKQELERAADILGIREIILWDYPDGGLDSLRDKEQELTNKLINAINSVYPNTIITFGPDGVSGHRDHIAIGALAVKTARAYAERRRKEAWNDADIKVYGVTIPREFNHAMEQVIASRRRTTGHYDKSRATASPALREVERVDIANFTEKKFAAMRAHSSQNPEGLIAAYTSQPKEFWTYEYFLPLL